MVPFRSGYLIEIDTGRLVRLSLAAESAGRVVDKVDISRVKSVRYFDEEDAAGPRNLDEAWAAAPKVQDGRAFLVWFMPLRDKAAGEHLLQKIASMRGSIIVPAPPLLSGNEFDLASAPPALRRSIRVLAGVDRLRWRCGHIANPVKPPPRLWYPADMLSPNSSLRERYSG